MAASGVPRVEVEPCKLEAVPKVFERMRAGSLVGRAVVQF